MPVERDLTEEDVLRASLEETTRRLEGLDARIAEEFPDYADLSDPTPIPLNVVQSLLAPDEALIMYLSDYHTGLWIIRPDEVFFMRTEISAETLATEVQVLRAYLDPHLNPRLKAFSAARAHALYQKILAPGDSLLAGANHIIVVPDGPLQSLPFGVLVTSPPQRDPITSSDHRGVAWLVHNYSVTILPSVSSLRALRQHAKTTRARLPFLGIGNPKLRGANGANAANLFYNEVANAERIRELAPLPETEEELRRIAHAMGATENDLLLGERANERVIRQFPLDQYRVISFATHALVSGELEGLTEPALVLTPPVVATPDDDGLLTTAKIARLILDADCVVLSACNTAAGDGTPDAGGLTGLAKAFFYAGSRSLLVSHWPVWSAATVALMTVMFEEITKDASISRAEALRRSMIAMLAAPNPSEFAHPLAWGAFALVGGVPLEKLVSPHVDSTEIKC